MTWADRIFTFLTVLFSTLVAFGNIIYQKFVIINIFDFHNFELSVGGYLISPNFLNFRSDNRILW